MSRINPWFLWPVLAALVVGGMIGWIVTSISCQPDTCYGTAIAVTIVGALVCGGGVAVVVVLAVRSFAEWREASGGGVPPPASDEPSDDDA